MLYTSTLVLVEGSNSNAIAQTYGPLINKALYNTMSTGSLDILVLKFQNTIKAVQKLVAAFYEIARVEGAKIGREGVSVNVLLDGQNLEMGRKQYWEVISAGKYGERFAEFP